MAVRKRKTEKTQLSPVEVLAVTGAKPKKARKAPKAAKAPAVLLDYPQEGEAVLPGSYTIRVAAGCEHKVELSIDGGPWTECRQSVGYYWYDWNPSAPGEHRLVARAKNGGPRFMTSEERVCLVLPPSAN
ncbi:MAG: hypothetical protein HYZ75_04260 [Elusimicrobia bacterium]|nr:hypothetical protein [Elusimicrobiota bacterium]